MHAALAFGHVALGVGRAGQRGLQQRLVNGLVPGGAQGGHVNAGALIERLGLKRAGRPELFGERQQVIDRGLRAAVRFWGAVAQAHQPVARVAQVVAHFLQALGGDGGQVRVGAVLQAFPHADHQRTVEKVAHEAHGPVALATGGGHQASGVRQFQQYVVAEVGIATEVGQRVFGDRAGRPGGAARCAHVAGHALGGVLVQQARLADQIEAVVGHGQVFLEDRRVAAPLGIALAQHDGVVGQVQQVGDGRLRFCSCWRLSGGRYSRIRF